MPELVTRVNRRRTASRHRRPHHRDALLGRHHQRSQPAVMGTYEGLPDTVKRILLDFSKVEYLNSSGIALVIQMMIAASKKGTDPSIPSASAPHFKKSSPWSASPSTPPSTLMNLPLPPPLTRPPL